MDKDKIEALENAIRNIEHAAKFTTELSDTGSRLTQQTALFLAKQCILAVLDQGK